MFTIFTRSAVCIYLKSGLLTLLTSLFITKKTAMMKVSQSLLSLKWDQLHKRYFRGIQRFISKLPLYILCHAQVRQGLAIGIRVTCTAYFSDVAFQPFPLYFICKAYCGSHRGKLIIKSHNSIFRQSTTFKNSNHLPPPLLLHPQC